MSRYVAAASRAPCAPARCEMPVATSPFRQLLRPIRPVACWREQRLVDARLVVEALGVAGRDELDEVVEALGRLRQQHQMVGRLARLRPIDPSDRPARRTLAAENRLDAALARLVVEDDRREQVAVLGHGHRRHLQLGAPGRAARRSGSAPSSSENSVCRWRWTNSVMYTRALTGSSRTLADSGDSWLFPLDRRRRLRADVVDDAVDAAHLVDDARRDARRAGRAAAAPSRRSCRRGSRRRGSRPCTRRSARRPSRRRSAPAAAPRTTATAADTSRPCGLPPRRSRRRGAAASSRSRVIAPSSRTARPGPGKRLAPRRTRRRGRASRPTRAHFVLEELAQRLDELELHPLGQAADVVVALDHRRRPDDRHALDHVRIERALREKVEPSELVRAPLEHVDERRRR